MPQLDFHIHEILNVAAERQNKLIDYFVVAERQYISLKISPLFLSETIIEKQIEVNSV